ncbi:phiSA1p31-related protein [Streptomyces malaysiensis subsp. malaysiensis]
MTGDTETIDGVTYDLNARYEDRAGDIWARQDDGLWWVDQWSSGRMATIDTHPDTDNESYRDYTLVNVVDTFGPLTRI